jgi:hypothetical protein
MSPPPLLRIVGPQIPARSLLVVLLVEALRGRGYRIAITEQLNDGRPSVTLPNGSRVTPALGTSTDGLAAFVESLDPYLNLILAEGYEEPDTPAIKIIENGSYGNGSEKEPFASIEAADLTSDIEVHGTQAVEQIAVLIDKWLRKEGATPNGVNSSGLLGRLRRSRQGR